MKKSLFTEADGEEEGALELHSKLQPALRLRLHTHRTAPGDDRPAPIELDTQSVLARISVSSNTALVFAISHQTSVPLPPGHFSGPG